MAKLTTGEAVSFWMDSTKHRIVMSGSVQRGFSRPRLGPILTDCFVVTTRPQTYAGDSLLNGFRAANIDPLTPDMVATFLEKWCRLVSH